MKIFQTKDRAGQMSRRLFCAFVLLFLVIPYLGGVLLVQFFTIFVDEGIAQVKIGGEVGLIFVVGWATLFLVMLVAFLARRSELSTGGIWVVNSLSAIHVSQYTDDYQRQRYQNVVEEMAIAANVLVPSLYVIPTRQINALVAGSDKNNTALMVTQGALERLTRDEFSALVAHEMGHIASKDVYINTSMIAALFGLMCLFELGWWLTRRGDIRNGGPLLGLAFMALGLLGFGAGRLIQAAVSRQREWLADAQSAQFTRQPMALVSLLRKIKTEQQGNPYQWDDPRASNVAHMCFMNRTAPRIFGLLATHPPLEKRIAVARGQARI